MRSSDAPVQRSVELEPKSANLSVGAHLNPPSTSQSARVGSGRSHSAALAMILGLGFALVCALGTNVSSLLKARGAAALSRPVQVRHPLRSAADLFRSRWFAVGWILALFAWGLHIEALALAPALDRASDPVRRARLPRCDR